jgi:hypothetical protein
MRARVSDPIGPFWQRALVPGLAVLIMAAGIVLPVEEVTAKGILFFLGAALLFAGSLAVPRLGARDAAIELGNGFIDVKNAGAANQRIRTRDVTAASTARTKDGVALALVRKGRAERPMVLDLATDEDARRVCDALGIGHYGFGSLAWPTARGSSGNAAIVTRLGAAACMLMLAAGMSEAAFLAIGAGLAYLFVPLALVMMVVNFFPRQKQAPNVTLVPEGLGVSPDGRRYETIPYANIADVTTTKRGIRITLHEGKPVEVVAPTTSVARSRMSDAERDHLVAQILSAAQRAHGVGPAPPVLPTRVADLGKRAERGRSWLARLDATAQLLAGGAGYRGCGFEEADLWSTLEDHDAPADVRAAAARVLVRVGHDDAIPRVESVLARVRDDVARERIRIATDDDIDAAGEELDRLDAKQRVA